MTDYTLSDCGDRAITLSFGQEISPQTNARVRAILHALQGYAGKGIEDCIPAYASLTVVYNPERISYRKLCRILRCAAERTQKGARQGKRVHYIPVCYGGAYGEDLVSVAQYSNLPSEEVVRRHCAEEYLIYMVGFLPGFPYLGGLDKSIACPRLDTPRTLIPCGSVGIGGDQTGIYPMPSPGGWRLIGRTPVRIYDPNRNPAVLWQAGEYIRFYPIDEEEYARIEREVSAGRYLCRTEEEV